MSWDVNLFDLQMISGRYTAPWVVYHRVSIRWKATTREYADAILLRKVFILRTASLNTLHHLQISLLEFCKSTTTSFCQGTMFLGDMSLSD